MKEVVLAFAIIFIWASSSISGTIYDSKNGHLFFGGVDSYVDVQPYEDRDESLKNKVVKMDVESGSRTTFFASNNLLGNIDVSPDGNYVSISDVIGEYNNYYAIKLFDKNGIFVKNILQVVYNPVWRYDSKYLAYATGQVAFDDKEPFVANGLWICNIETGDTTKVSDRVYGFSFSRSDGNLYYVYEEEGDKPPVIYSYEMKNGNNSKTSLFGINISPNGKYYIKGSGQEDYALYDIDNKRQNWLDKGFYDKVYWIDNEHVYNGYIRRSFVVSPFNGDIKHEFKGDVMGWSSDRRYVVTYKDKHVFITETLTGKIINSIRIRE